MSGTGRRDNDKPVDLDELTTLRASMSMWEPEFAILMRRGISFRYVAQSFGAAVFWAVLALAFVWMGLLSGTMKEPFPDYPIVSAVVSLAACAVLGWLWMDRLRRDDRIVINNDGLSLWQGERRTRAVTWEAFCNVRKVWPGVAMISARNGSTIWISSSVQQYDFLVAFLQWILPIDRSGRSLGAIVETALRRGVRFRASMTAELLIFACGLPLLALGLFTGWEFAERDDWNVDALWVGACALIIVAVSAGCIWLAWISFEGRNDEILIRADGVEGRNRYGVTYISWLEATQPDALRALDNEDNTDFLRDSSGQKRIEGVMRFDEVSRLLLQYMLMRHVSERDWDALRSLDQLKP